ncbi:hypothetical protein AAES_77779 [Amazona aestiva]|uniref:Uncharacterized protein n=1 Tax=Amazona aestiva TaxID=12930 RepID=A0A0Q3PLB7_AMAAE|nr:hypothetical protein AAES_77779 [Amazona aestiva]
MQRLVSGHGGTRPEEETDEPSCFPIRHQQGSGLIALLKMLHPDGNSHLGKLSKMHKGANNTQPPTQQGSPEDSLLNVKWLEDENLHIKGIEQEEAVSQPILTGEEQIQESRKQEDNAPSKLPQGVGSMTTSA